MIKKTVFFFLFFVRVGVSSEVPMADASRLPAEALGIFTFMVEEDEDNIRPLFLKINENTVGSVLFERLKVLFLKYRELFANLPKISVSKGLASAFYPTSADALLNFDALAGKEPEIIAINKSMDEEKDLKKWLELFYRRENLKKQIIENLQKNPAKCLNKDLVLRINTDDLVEIACVVEAGLKDNSPVILVGSCLPDVRAMIVHELIHMKHYLEEELGEANKTAVTGMPYPDLALIPISQARELRGHRNSLLKSPCLANLPEIEATREESPWTEFEERRTVCGPDQDGITELAYRISAKLPNRYFYLTGNSPFYEQRLVWKKVVDSVIEGWNEKHPSPLSVDWASFLPKMDLPATVINSAYTPVL